MIEGCWSGCGLDLEDDDDEEEEVESKDGGRFVERP